MNYGLRFVTLSCHEEICPVSLITGDRDQDHPMEKKCKKSKMAVWGGLTNSCEKKRSEKQRKKGKI